MPNCLVDSVAQHPQCCARSTPRTAHTLRVVGTASVLAHPTDVYTVDTLHDERSSFSLKTGDRKRGCIAAVIFFL